ncbi:hypothetical protein AFA91_12130 [Mycolicibacterium goodii]|uniref:Uncharacterized protein n=1 Tax=Mycolicibacterium goodii TaxID=134601 RepID=A0A0K0X587_MYCGD|nr:hypothetical protein AFA91_12130 [Mycolicibacterium goodii]
MRWTFVVVDRRRRAGGAGRIPQASAHSTAATAADAHHAAFQSLTASTSTADRAIPAPTPPNPQPARCAGWECRCSSIVLTAITNTSALTAPAIARSVIHSIVVVANGITARLATSTSSDTRHANGERANRGQIDPATAPTR